ncbi:hypothetical protein MRX96_032146 [Rhipicephalus microplus]|uniref:Putative bpti/kunitz family of serine protease inhibitor n=1 Tax=Rhipicephalus microplus TaxID=6941 RepID=A0A6G5A2M6_RHIMP
MTSYFIVVFSYITTCDAILFNRNSSCENISMEERYLPPASEDYPPSEEEDPDKRPDICLLRPEPGICPETESMTQWFFDSSMGACTTFTYNGCDGNDNRFSSCQECMEQCKSDICAAPNKH